MQRYQMLYDKKSVSPQEFDEVKTKLAAAKARRDAAHAGRAQAEAAVSQANTAVGFTRIRAPFDGLVTAKLADAGAMAAPGVPLLMVEDPSRFRLEAKVDESQIGAVRLGATVPVVIDSLGEQTITGKVVQIVPAADPASRTLHGEDRAAVRIRRFARDCSAARDFRAASANPFWFRKPRCCIAGNWTRSTWSAKTRSPACATSRWASLPATRSKCSPDWTAASASSRSPAGAS